MKIIVSKDIVKLNENHSENHYGEYNVNECVFEFDEYFDSVPIKKAIFTSQSNNKSFEIDIINNKCTVPHEVLTKVYDTVILGVYGYDVNEETLLVRYSPEPTTFVVHEGSYKEGAEQPEIITPTQYDMYSKALQEGLAEVDKRLDDVEKQGDYASEQGDYAKEQGSYAKEQGTNAKNIAEETEKKAQKGAFDGKSLEFVWEGTKLGVRLEGQEEYHFVDLQGVQGEVGATGEPFKIKKTYGSVSEMNADFGNMQFGDYVMIASSVNEEDNAKLYTRGESAWIFISDFSGAMGIRGETGLTPNIQIGEVKTLEPGSQAKVTRSGSNEEPVFNFELPKGDKGDDYVLTEEDKVEIGEKVNTEYEERIEQNEKYISELEATIDILTNTDTKKGELVHITDALPLATFENKVDGNVKQETTTGANIFQMASYIKDDYGVNITCENNLLTLNGTQTNVPDASSGRMTSLLSETGGNYYNYDNSPDYLTLEAGTYTAKLIKISGTKSESGYPFLSVVTGDTSPKTRVAQVHENSSVSFTLTEPTIVRQNISIKGTYTDYKARVTLTKSSTATDEKFTNGASPNPSYPQEIEVLEGYNFFNSFIATQSKYQTSGELQIEKDGTLVVSGNTSSNNYFALTQKLGEICPDLKVGDTVYLYLETTSNVKQVYIGENWTHNNPKTITEEMLNKTFVIYGGYNQTDKIKIQVLKEPNKPYLPYGAIGYKVNGKNLLNVDAKKNTYNGMEFTPIYKDNGTLDYINVNGTATSDTYLRVHQIERYDIDKQKTYIINGSPSGGSIKTYGMVTYYYDENNTYINGVYEFGNGVQIPQSAKLNVNIFVKTGTTMNNAKFYPMLSLEGGDYEPYQEQIVYLDLKGNWVGKVSDTIKDELYTKKKHLLLDKVLKKRVFTGNEEWNTWGVNYSTEGITGFYSMDFNDYNQSLIKYIKSTHFINNANAWGGIEIGINASASGNPYIIMSIPNDALNDISSNAKAVESFKTWLSNNPVEVLYPTKEIEIIDLGELPEPIKTFEGVNNIQLLANLDTEIEVTYALDVKKYFENKLASIQEQIL